MLNAKNQSFSHWRTDVCCVWKQKPDCTANPEELESELLTAEYSEDVLETRDNEEPWTGSIQESNEWHKYLNVKTVARLRIKYVTIPYSTISNESETEIEWKVMTDWSALDSSANSFRWWELWTVIRRRSIDDLLVKKLTSIWTNHSFLHHPQKDQNRASRQRSHSQYEHTVRAH